MKHLWLCIVLLSSAFSAQAEPQDLKSLLQQVKETRNQEARINRERETAFKRERDQQARLLAEAKAELATLQSQSTALRELFDSNEKLLAEREEALREQSGVLNELSGVARQSAGELRAVLENSIISAQYPNRGEALKDFAQSKSLPTLNNLEDLWIAIQQEMTESGEISRFNTDIINTEGASQQAEVYRIGPFSAIANGGMLKYLPETGQLAELPRQPDGEYANLARAWQNHNGNDVVPMVVDPTRGAILGLLTQAPSLVERVQQGGLVGYIILALGVIGILVALARLFWLANVGRKVKAQMKTDAELRDNNPLGRVLLAPGDDKTITQDKLESILDQSILREVPRLERGNNAIKLLAAVAPMLGLLGTVTGMIATFQAVSLFGTGDPKLMAGGISQALMTTLMGLGVAIPLLFAHSMVSSRSKVLINILDEQSAGLIAKRLS